MDPLSVIAITGLVYAGKVLCEKKEKLYSRPTDYPWSAGNI